MQAFDRRAGLAGKSLVPALRDGSGEARTLGGEQLRAAAWRDGESW